MLENCLEPEFPPAAFRELGPGDDDPGGRRDLRSLLWC
jgi:hypothetical protein